MASIRKLPSGKWNVQIRKKGQKVRSRTFECHVEAEAWVSSIESREAKKSIRKTDQMITWLEAANQYVMTMLKGRPSQRTFEHKVRMISKHAVFKKPLNEITSQEISDFKLKRSRVVNSTTLRDELVIIRRIFKWAHEEAQAAGMKPINDPSKLVRIPKAARPRDRVVERHELDLILNALPEIMKPIVELAYETAMRRSEIVNLRVKHLHLEQRLLSVIRGKEGDRSVPLTKRAVEILQEARDAAYGPESRIFPVAPDSVTMAFRRARNKIGLSSDIRFHQLRHTRCTIVARKGFNQAQMMIVTGHKDIRSVQRYTHLNAGDVVNLLD